MESTKFSLHAMNNKAADPRGITLIFSALAIALAIILFYVWFSTAQISRQQNAIDGNVAFIYFDNYLTQKAIENPELFEGNPDTLEKNLHNAFKQDFSLVYIWSDWGNTCVLREGKTACGFTIYLKQPTNTCQTGYERELIFEDYKTNNGRKIAKQPRIIKIKATICT